MNLALLSNVTVDLISHLLKKQTSLYTSNGFDMWQQELLSPSSRLYHFNPEAVVVLLHANAYNWNNDGQHIIDEWCHSFRVFTDKLPSVPLFVSSIDISNIMCQYGSEKKLDVYYENYLIDRVQEMHKDGCNIYILPIKKTITDIGRDNFYSSKMWYYGSMPYSNKGISSIANTILCYVAAIRGMRKKCIAVDLDNTLWGGVVGEDGVGGLVLAESNEGARFYDTQRLLKKMKEQGVMLAVLSKNNVEDVEAAFKHPSMVLKHEDFVSEIINWETKTNNIRKLAKSLNIGLDSFVFLDDNPAEREQMKVECPEVTVVEFPLDSSQLPIVIEKVYEQYFLSIEITNEDIHKTEMYRAENQRMVELHSSTSVENFLKNLEMRMDIHFMRPEEEKRVLQLINKTNQFNLTTKRYNEDEIHVLAKETDSDVLTVHIADKYGNHGLVAVLVLKYESSCVYIDSFLMSCRVMGRCVENEILAQIKNILSSKGFSRIKSTYIKSAKNAPVIELYENLGFSLISGLIQEIGDKKEYEACISSLPNSTGMFRITESIENTTF